MEREDWIVTTSIPIAGEGLDENVKLDGWDNPK
jgi:hypothetical protein